MWEKNLKVTQIIYCQIYSLGASLSVSPPLKSGDLMLAASPSGCFSAPPPSYPSSPSGGGVSSPMFTVSVQPTARLSNDTRPRTGNSFRSSFIFCFRLGYGFAPVKGERLPQVDPELKGIIYSLYCVKFTQE